MCCDSANGGAVKETGCGNVCQGTGPLEEARTQREGPGTSREDWTGTGALPAGSRCVRACLLCVQDVCE